MKKSTVIVIIAAIVALIAVRGIQQIGKSRQKAPPGGGFVKILPKDMRAADIHKIEVYRGDAKDDAVVLARTKQGWTVPSRFNSKGDDKNINSLLDDIKKLEGEVRTEKKELHKDFGITDEKAVHVALYDEKGKLYRNLLLGKKGERFSEGFVRLADRKEVYLADRNLLSNLGLYGENDKPEAKKWLDLKIMDKKSDDVAKVVLDMPGKQVILEKKEKKEEKKEGEAEEAEKPPVPEEKEEKKEYEWVLVEPETEFKLKDWAAKSVASSVCQFKGEDVADPAKMDEYGFDSPTYTAAVTMDDDSSETLLVGKKTEKDDKRYARLKEGNTVYIVPQYTVGGVFKKMRDLVDIKIWDLKKEEVASIDLHRPEYEILLERQPKEGSEAKEPKDLKWVLAKPETRFKLKDYRIDSIVSRVIKPSPEDFFVAGELQSYGLDEPEFKAVLKMKDDSSHEVLVGKKLEDSEDRYAKFGDKDHVYSFSKYNFEQLFPTLAKLLTVEIMEDLQEDEVVSLKYDTAEEDFVLTRKEGEEGDKKKWAVKVGEEESEAKSAIVDDILDAITGIEPEDMVIGKSDADCGLDKPIETLTISTKKTPDQYALLFGKKVSEESADQYFRVKDQPEIFVLSEANFGKIFKKVKDLKVQKPPEPEEKKPPAEVEAAPPPEQPPGPPTEEKPTVPTEKPAAPEEELKESPEGKEEKAEPAAPSKKPQEKKEEAEPAAPEKQAPPAPQPEGEKGEETSSPEKEKAAPQPPAENPSLDKLREQIPPPPLPEIPKPKEPVPLPAPGDSSSK